MFESLVKFRSQCLQLHSRLPTVRRTGAPSDEAVNLLFDVDEWLFHGAASISGVQRKCKPAENLLFHSWQRSHELLPQPALYVEFEEHVRAEFVVTGHDPSLVGFFIQSCIELC